MADFTFVERKPMDGRELTLDADATIGREGCDVVLPDPEVSRPDVRTRSMDDIPSSSTLGRPGRRILPLAPRLRNPGNTKATPASL